MELVVYYFAYREGIKVVKSSFTMAIALCLCHYDADYASKQLS